MSIELKEAKKQLDILEKLVKEPNLILSDLFPNGENDTKLFYKLVTINNKTILTYLIDYLKTLDIFDGCRFQLIGYELNIFIPSLKYGTYSKFQPDDKVIKISISSKTYKLCETSIHKYTDVMNEHYKLKVDELPEVYKDLEDLSFNNKLILISKSLKSKKKLSYKLLDFVIFTSGDKIRRAVNNEKAKIKDKNEQNLKDYNRLISLQNYYKENAPDQIKQIKDKQKIIAKFLTTYGYNEDIELDE